MGNDNQYHVGKIWNKVVPSILFLLNSTLTFAIAEYNRIKEGDEKALAQALAKFGPISAAIHVTKNFQFYGDKIFDDPECRNSPDNLNHAILIVGYGQEADGRKYWLVKNSYGTTWGVDGYFKVAKDEGNKCGIATYARYPNV